MDRHLATIFATTAGMKGLAIVAVLLGLTIRYWLGRRAFYRRNSFGTETFKSYENMRLTNFMEGLARFAAFFLIIAGIVVFVLMLTTQSGRHN